MSENQKAKENVIQKIAKNYIQMEKYIVDQLQLDSQHYVTIGGFREEIWKSMFEQIIPRKFSVERSVFIIDSHGRVSKEVDLAIFDEQYTPYIFRYGTIKYLPIEAVAVVVQCKSNSLDDKNIKDWIDSINKLKTSLKSVTRTISDLIVGEHDYKTDQDGVILNDQGKHKPLTQTSTRPIRILCHTGNSTKETIADLFDIVLHPLKDRLSVEFPAGKQSLASWYAKLNHADDKYKNIRVEIKDGKAKEIQLESYRVYEHQGGKDEIALLSLTFQLNQLLMLINNPILFPHLAYVEMFNRANVGAQ